MMEFTFEASAWDSALSVLKKGDVLSAVRCLALLEDMSEDEAEDALLELEERGIVGPFEGSKPRQLLITKEQWQEMKYRQGTVLPKRESMEQAPMAGTETDGAVKAENELDQAQEEQL